ncbi:S41 family peptidase [Fibrella forsythiae]|uniref:S41 family peptidase n=1 Tax=Fibrella forsythiae TaxID=2817061 RepID=A0ABS3JSR5_9BACT|nr:S41 family peptidase [Fibrella forsythiae]MBO0953067.1 S41 family peptidase [Fibrella forsythiae]
MLARYLLLFFLVTKASISHGQLLTPAQLQADFTRFQTALNEAHPAMYRYTSKNQFDSLAAAVATRLNQPMTQHQFYLAMMPLVVALRDGHIKWLLPGQDEHYPFFTDNLFPLKLYFLGERAWILGHYGADAVPTGAEVLTINDQPIATIIGKLLPNMAFADGYTVSSKYEDLNHFFSGYYATFIGAPARHQLTCRIGDSTQTIQLPAQPLAAIKAYNDAHTPSARLPYYVTFEDSSRAATLTIKRFWTEKNEQKFKPFLAEAFRQIDQKRVQHLILDLRDNEGGEENYGVWLYKYLAQKPFRYYDHISVRQKKAYSFPAWTPKLYQMFRWLVVRKRGNSYVFVKQLGLKRHKPQPSAYAGKLYVLINGGSFSVTTELAARIHADGRGTFIGQETGGALEGNNSGIFAITQLPNAKIDLGIPLFGFYMADLPRKVEKGQGIRPDYPVTPTGNDVLTGNDRAMQCAKQLIQLAGQATPQPASMDH